MEHSNIYKWLTKYCDIGASLMKRLKELEKKNDEDRLKPQSLQNNWAFNFYTET